MLKMAPECIVMRPMPNDRAFVGDQKYLKTNIPNTGILEIFVIENGNKR